MGSALKATNFLPWWLYLKKKLWLSNLLLKDVLFQTLCEDKQLDNFKHWQHQVNIICKKTKVKLFISQF